MDKSTTTGIESDLKQEMALGSQSISLDNFVISQFVTDIGPQDRHNAEFSSLTHSVLPQIYRTDAITTSTSTQRNDSTAVHCLRCH